MLAVAAAAAALMLAAAPAAAHDELLASDPPDGATVAEGPAELLLTFSAEVTGLGAAVQVLDGDGTDWADGQPEIDGVQVVQPLRADMAAGAYAVAWRVVSSDGHPVSGVLSFTVAEGQASPSPSQESARPVSPSPEPTASPSDGEGAPAGDGQTPEATSTPGTGGTDPAGPEETVTDQQPDQAGWAWWPVAVVVVLLAAAGATAVLLRRRAARSRGGQV